MNVIVGGRASGKTYQIVQWYKDARGSRAIIVGTNAQRDSLIQDYKVDKNDIYLLNQPEVLRGHTGEFACDFDLDYLLYHYLGLVSPYQTLGPVTINGAVIDLNRRYVPTPGVKGA